MEERGGGGGGGGGGEGGGEGGGHNRVTVSKDGGDGDAAQLST